MSKEVSARDLQLLQRAIDLARRARDHGNHPFGALLAGPDGQILLEAENTVVTDRDSTGHAETNLVRLASQAYSPEFLAGCTLYTSTEPCAMCAGAIFWGNIRRVVFALSEEGLYAMIGEETEEMLRIPSRELFARGAKSVKVIGPLLEEEAHKVHEGFWSNR